MGTQVNVTQGQCDECVKLSEAAARGGFNATIPKPFYIGKFEVTQEQWQKVMGSNPSYHTEKVVGVPSGNYRELSAMMRDSPKQ